jgi:hypothetical protein
MLRIRLIQNKLSPGRNAQGYMIEQTRTKNIRIDLNEWKIVKNE